MINLITGATGHIGNALARQLLARGQKVRALVRPGKNSTALNDLKIEFAFGDILDPDSLVRALEGVDVIYHLAARISIATGPDPETVRVNLDGTRNLIRAMSRPSTSPSGMMSLRAVRLVYASSIYALRVPAKGTVDESCPFDAQSTRGEYDRSKAAASIEVQNAVAEGLDAVIVCPTAVTGPFDYQMSEAGRGILYNLQPGIKFYVDGAYDFVDVRDAAAGCILAAEKGRRGETYILGGDRLTVREVAETIWEAAGGWHVGIHLPNWVADLAASIMPVIFDDPIVTPYSLGAVRSNSHISHARASDELGYLPRPAKQAIRDAVHWWQESLNMQGEGFHSPVAESEIKAGG
jgi:dihydroflavonol-4-reductase